MKGINDLTIAPPFTVVLFCEICKQSKFISWGIIWELKGQNTKKYSDVCSNPQDFCGIRVYFSMIAAA